MKLDCKNVIFIVLRLQEESGVGMQGPCDVARVRHGKEGREFLVLPTGQERFNQEKLLRYKFNTTDKWWCSSVC